MLQRFVRGTEMKKYNLSGEKQRSYLYYAIGDALVTKRITITKPVCLYYNTGHAFHRVWDGREVTLCHAPGPIENSEGKIVGWCVVIWKPTDENSPVKF